MYGSGSNQIPRHCTVVRSSTCYNPFPCAPRGKARKTPAHANVSQLSSAMPGLSIHVPGQQGLELRHSLISALEGVNSWGGEYWIFDDWWRMLGLNPQWVFTSPFLFFPPCIPVLLGKVAKIASLMDCALPPRPFSSFGMMHQNKHCILKEVWIYGQRANIHRLPTNGVFWPKVLIIQSVWFGVCRIQQKE